MRSSPFDHPAITRLRSACVLIATLLMLWVNGAAERVPFNGHTTAQLSDAFHVFVTPASYTFLIWAMLYPGLVAYSVYQLVSSHRYATRLQRIQAPYVLSCAANIGWLLLWHYEYFVASLLAMLVLLASLVVIYRRLQLRAAGTALERWCVDYVFGAYVAWISMATLINLAVVVDFLQLSAGGVRALDWAMLMVGIATAIGSTMALTRRDPVFLLVILWALAGIALKSGQAPVITALAWAGFAIVGGFLAWMSLVRRPRAAHA